MLHQKMATLQEKEKEVKHFNTRQCEKIILSHFGAFTITITKLDNLNKQLADSHFVKKSKTAKSEIQGFFAQR